MARFGFVGPSYQSQSVNADCQQTMNWYPEILESGQSKSGMVLYPTPGLKAFFTPPDPGPCRGIYTVNSRTFHVSANNVYEVGILGTAIKTYAASVTNDGLPVSFAGGGTQLLIASGGNAYVVDLVANTLTLIPAGTLTNVSMVAYIDGFFLALIKNSNQLFSSSLLDATTWPGLNTTKVSVFTDNVTSIIADHRELGVIGPRAAQVYYDSGNFPFPLDIIPGAFIEQGIAAQFSIAKLDNSVFWLGSDERGNGIAWRMQGYNPVRISNHAVEFAWQGYSRIDDCVAYAYQDQGHAFYVLSFPAVKKTWVFDVATGMWHERGFWNTVNGTFSQHSAQYHTFNFGKHLVGGSTNGVLYQMSIAFADDFGNVIRRVRRAPHISQEQEWIFHQQLQVDFEVGLGSFPNSITGPTYILMDANGVFWLLQITNGNLQTRVLGAGPVTSIRLNDPTNAATWQLGVTITGFLTTTLIANNPAGPQTIPMVSVDGTANFNLGVTLAGNLTTTQTGVNLRGALATMRWSDDGGHTWSNSYQVDCGQTGKYKQRAIWRRLGRSRDRVYEVSVSDGIPWRVIDAYLMASPGYQPQERISRTMAKTA